MELERLNSLRKGSFRKEKSNEDFLSKINTILHPVEFDEYEDFPIDKPIIFTLGVPRSGTTIVTQVLAHSFDFGYINNLAARFWMAPLYGLKLSESLSLPTETSFISDYGSTKGWSAIHDFGYFWRYWLQIDSWTSIKKTLDHDSSVNWAGLYKTLANLQNHLGKPMIFKNIFGAYYIESLTKVLKNVFYIYIQRDSADNACSILEARKKYYTDLNTWWSTMPYEYEELKNENYWNQIAGQVVFLNNFYKRIISKQESLFQNTFKVHYSDLTQNTNETLEKIQSKLSKFANQKMELINDVPELMSRTYSDSSDKRKLEESLRQFKLK